MTQYPGRNPIQVNKCAICGPIVGPSMEEILSQVHHAVQAEVDMIELRADMWMRQMKAGEAEYIEKILHIIEQIETNVAEISMLFTWRTLAEGGETLISSESYGYLLQAVVDQDLVKAIDVELFVYTDRIGQIIKQAHHQGIQTVMSYHNFHKTLEIDTLHLYAEQMISAGASVIKFALMPTTSDDVFSVLQFTKELTRKYPQLPRITMSMGQLGQMTRTCGNVFGNCVTFGTLGQASAPGQVEVAVLKQLV